MSCGGRRLPEIGPAHRAPNRPAQSSEGLATSVRRLRRFLPCVLLRGKSGTVPLSAGRVPLKCLYLMSKSQ